jgi:hypothetical protein
MEPLVNPVSLEMDNTNLFWCNKKDLSLTPSLVPIPSEFGRGGVAKRMAAGRGLIIAGSDSLSDELASSRAAIGLATNSSSSRG